MSTFDSYTPFTNPYYFESDKDCVRHDNFKCTMCEEQSQKEYRAKEGIKQDITIVPLQETKSSRDMCARDEAVENFNRHIRFVKTVLSMDDAKIDKIEVQQLPALVQKAQKKATVGNMKQLFRQDRQSSMMRIIDHLFCACKRRFL